MIDKGFFSKLHKSLDPQRKCRVSVPVAQDEACAFAICEGVKKGVVGATLFGNPDEIRQMYGEAASQPGVEIVPESDVAEASRKAVAWVREGKADILMKGLVPTSVFLKAVLHSKDGLKKNPLLSHLTFFEAEKIRGMKILTDVAINISPDADALGKMVLNAVEAFRSFSDRTPRVGILAANEKVSEKMPSTTLAKSVADQFRDRTDVIVEGPIALDLGVSPESAKIKKYGGKIQGNADILVVPRIETGNVMYKSLQYYVHADMGGVVFGARCPIVLTSRADDNETKFNSLLLAVVLWQKGIDAKEAHR